MWIPDEVLGSIVPLWKSLRGVSDCRAILDLAQQINLLSESEHRWLLRECGEISDDPDEARELALKKADLVLLDFPRAVYWCGTEIDIDWNKNGVLWEYVDKLVRAAKRERGIDNSDFANSCHPDHLAKLKSRLLNSNTKSGSLAFPANLAELLTTVRRYEHKLNLPAERICILVQETKGTVREIC